MDVCATRKEPGTSKGFRASSLSGTEKYFCIGTDGVLGIGFNEHFMQAALQFRSFLMHLSVLLQCAILPAEVIYNGLSNGFHQFLLFHFIRQPLKLDRIGNKTAFNE